MKAPNITPGAWKANGDPFVSTADGKHCIAFTDGRSLLAEEMKANAQAISAVPDLIAALIDADSTFESDGYNVEGPTRLTIRAALLKAGCTE